MTEAERMELQARLKGIETALQFTLAMAYMAGKFSPAGAKRLQDAFIEMLGKTTIPAIDPATSDHLSAEMTDATKNILDGALVVFGKLR